MDLCPICLENKNYFDNTIVCYQCGQQICGVCAREMAKIFSVECPVCRTPYFTKTEIMIEGLEKIVKREEKVNSFAEVCLGALYYKLGRFKESFQLFQKNNRKKYKGITRYMADMYRYGKGVKRNPGKAYKLYVESFGIPGSMLSVGYMYMVGDGVKKNTELGRKLIDTSQNIFPTNCLFHCKTGKIIASI